MDKKNLFAKMKGVLQLLETYKKTQTIIMSEEQRSDMRLVMGQITPGVTVDFWCTACVKHNLFVMQSYYEREHPKYLESLTPEEKVEETKVKLSNQELMAKARAARELKYAELRKKKEGQKDKPDPSDPADKPAHQNEGE